MNYDRDIIFVLGEAGPKGLSVKKIAKHVLITTMDFSML